MPDDTPRWPEKTREIVSPMLDSRPWNDFPFRDDDVVVSSPAKSGTTWTQAILIQLLHGAPVAPRVNNISRWVDGGFDQDGRLEALAAQTHRRVMKSHLPADALVLSPKAKYIHVTRDGRDVAWSGFNHLYESSDAFYDMINADPRGFGPPAVRPGEDPRANFHEWLARDAAAGNRDGFLAAHFFDVARSWWAVRDLPNVHLLHFQHLKDDLPGQVDTLAAFLDIAVSDGLKETVLKHVSFDHMKAHADTMFPELPLKGGRRSFINKGTNGRWRDVLTPDDIASYEARALAELGPDCAHWVATGEMRR